MWLTSELNEVARQFGGDLVTKIRTVHYSEPDPRNPGCHRIKFAPAPSGDLFEVGQIGTVQAPHPRSRATVNLGSFEYIGDDRWTPVKPGTPAGMRLMLQRFSNPY